MEALAAALTALLGAYRGHSPRPRLVLLNEGARPRSRPADLARQAWWPDVALLTIASALDRHLRGIPRHPRAGDLRDPAS